MKIDMWYGNKISEVAFIDCWFSDCDCIYRGNLYDSNQKAIGDYSTKDSTEIEKQFGYDFG
jgi:hypothetical protein